MAMVLFLRSLSSSLTGAMVWGEGSPPTGTQLPVGGMAILGTLLDPAPAPPTTLLLPAPEVDAPEALTCDPAARSESATKWQG